MAVGSTKAPYYNVSDNSLNIVRLVSKQELPDSILYRRIGVGGTSEEDAAKRSDSIMNALQSGAAFKAMAEKYGQPSDSTWVTSSQLQQGQIDEDAAKFITSSAMLPSEPTKKSAWAAAISSCRCLTARPSPPNTTWP